MGNHALDGLIARAASLFGLCLWLASLLRARLIGEPARSSRRVLVTAFTLGAVGALIQLNAYVLSLADLGYAEASVWRPELAEFGRWLGPALQETQFGLWWCAHVATLVVVLLLTLRPRASARLTVFVAVGWILTFVRLGHAAGYPLVSVGFVIQLVHTVAVVGWLSGLLGLATHVLDESPPLPVASLRRFAHGMLVAMVVIVGTGVARLAGLLDAALTPWRESLYLWLIAAKLSLVALVLVAAALARRRIFGSQADTLPAAALKHVLTLEVLTASLVLFLSTLLSQVTPP